MKIWKIFLISMFFLELQASESQSNPEKSTCGCFAFLKKYWRTRKDLKSDPTFRISNTARVDNPEWRKCHECTGNDCKLCAQYRSFVRPPSTESTT